MSDEPRHSWIRRTASSVRARMAATLAVLAVVFALSVVVIFGFIRQQEADGTVINVAGRQRMLSQKMSKEAFAIAAGNEQLRTTLEETASEFDGSLTSLLEGNAERGLPAAQGEVKTQLEQVSALWDPFRQQVQVIQTASVARPEFETALAYIAENSVPLLNEMDNAVDLYEGQFADKINNLKWAVVSLAMVGALVAAGAWWLLFMGLSRPLSKLAAAANRLGRGEFHYRVDIDTASEVGTVARAFNRMTANLALITASRDELNKEIEERKQMEDALRLQSAALESAANAIVIADCEGRITWANPAFARLTGYTLEEAVGQNPRFLKSGVQDEPFYKRLWETILSGRVWHGEVINRRKDGSLYTEEMTITPVRDKRGEISHFIAIKQEITERKRMEEALRESEAKYRTIFENVQDIFCQTDMQDVIVEISPSVERFGYTRDALIGTSALDMYEDPEQRVEVVSAIMEHGEISDFEIRLKTGDGRGVDMSISAHVRYDADGVRLGVEGVLRDISLRKRMEKALRESEAKYRTIFENVQDIFYQTDMQGIIVEISPSVERFGYTREELIGTQVLDIYENPEDRSTLVKTILEHGEVLDYELRLKTGDGGVADASASAHLLRHQDGTAVGIEGVLRDITERKRAEEALERSLAAERERARRDPLTGVLNHGAISEELREQCSSAGESPVTVAMVDLDDLKLINDTYGHQVGDQALIIVANVLTRDNAVVGRYGGDEFIVILPGADRAEAERYRDVVTAKLLDARLPDPETDARIPVVASWGLAVFPEEAETIVALIHLSDSAMYAAKRQRSVGPGQLARRGPLGSDRAAEMVGALVPLLTSPGDLNDKLRLVSHQLSIGAGYDAVDFSMFAPEPGSPLAQNTFAQGRDDLLDAWHREQQDDSPEPHPLRLLFERSPRPVILNDPWNDELLLPPQREILQAAGLKSVLVAPLVWQNHVLGSLGVANRQEAAFTPADAQFLMAVASQVTAIMRTETLVSELRSTTTQLGQAHEETVLLLAAAAEAHDHTTGLHLQGVRDLTEALARDLGYAEADAIALGLASVLHDIGKIRVPDAILASPAKLEASQWEVMKQHTIWGADFLEGHPGFELAASVALHHHEHWDGGGYPEGIAGPAIPEAATIVAVADAFDAITHNRPYRAGRSVDEAVTEIAAYSGDQFNPKVVVALEHLHQSNELPTAYPEVIDTETAA